LSSLQPEFFSNLLVLHIQLPAASAPRVDRECRLFLNQRMVLSIRA
jgi:hypothetical protein